MVWSAKSLNWSIMTRAHAPRKRCAALLPLGCEADVSALSPSAAPGTRVSTLCPTACRACPPSACSCSAPPPAPPPPACEGLEAELGVQLANEKLLRLQAVKNSLHQFYCQLNNTKREAAGATGALPEPKFVALGRDREHQPLLPRL
jgi:hypothetical protein